ncbi:MULTISPECIES: hypothetical protein [unclassified Campylobacter]|uniref:hypothetical protein n=1 Tax=unclassified Campylobacter TaxID=2593542 RepID=UPI0022E999BB|nr:MULTISPECIES: hypothetical protein [unclassified Campylobacter]MDA3056116.1 hypothetical protein [Campylobacter sp. CN_NA1]MDA3065261.1 hypothetical protein [Campylobacter sp. CN_NE4]MDA3068086.1 hypothetical protein [Campylobacter sp. CN_NE3]MDA3082714.1 hypothetical protein [Campylobacter sp. CN_EL2]MDA3083547.1 hypothetical protein [Campylobacter sp. CN_NE1]
MNNQNKMRERAEQLKKNAEAKIQKAQLKEQKYQQDLEFQKKNNPNFRDYDKDPLIIQSYEEFFVLSLFMPSGILSAYFYELLEDFYKFNSVSFNIIWLIIPLAWILIAYLFQKTHFSKHKIKFTNQYIEFIDNGKLKKQCEIIENKLVKPFFTSCNINNKIPMIAFVYCMILLAIFLYYKGAKFFITIFVMLIFFCFFYILIKFLFYLFLNKSLKGFLVFPFIQVTDKSFTAPGHGILFSARYFLVYLYNDEIYKEVKKYFLQKNINIDNLPIRYLPF